MVPCRLARSLLALLLLSCSGLDASYEPVITEPVWIEGGYVGRSLTFSIAADMRTAVGVSGDGLFYDALDARASLDALGAGSFIVSPGDLDPASSTVEAAIQEVLGSAFPWFPLPGNHDAETSADMAFLRSYDIAAAAAGADASNYAVGPAGAEETCYSFDAGGAHFIALNEYYDGVSDVALSGEISPALYDWLAADLAAVSARSPAYIFVLGHEPIYPLPDESTGRIRHRGDSLDAHPDGTSRFVSLLRGYSVTAYICGHSHDYSAALVDGLLQVEAGRAGGLDDTGSPSTFLRASLYEGFVEFEAYRSTDGSNYVLESSVRALPRP